MSKHPRASDLLQYVSAFEKAGKGVAAVEVRWIDEEGKQVPVWRIVFSADGESRREEPVKW